jgi:tRNA dimethylallyltransferase
MHNFVLNAEKNLVTKKTIVNIIGATGIGKTSLSLELAKHFNTEIISSDSRQLYKEMSIGTAVPSKAELSSIKHHFIQHKSIQNTYNAGMFELEALDKINKIFLKKDLIVMVGGSGLYSDAVLYGLDHFPKVDSEIRKKLNHEIESGHIKVLQEQLHSLDPISYKNIDLHNPQRLIRALEICIGTGKPYASFKENSIQKRAFDFITVGLNAERDYIYQRINNRVDNMIEEGLLKEVTSLYAFKDFAALKTVGYKEIFNFLDGEYPLDFAIAEIKKNTRRFAKRQITWNKKYDTAKCFNAQALRANEVIAFIENNLKRTNDEQI